MGYKAGIDKKQLTLLSASLDDYIPENHICRVISAFSEQLDMESLSYKYAKSKDTGCRPYDPRIMLNLYIYGYLHRIRSSRRLRDEASRNVEVMWLMEGLTPDDKTICNFRKDNDKALVETFRVFSRMCRELGLYGGELIATDSTKFRANNSVKNNHNEVIVKNELSRIDKKISEYMNLLEQEDKEDENRKEPKNEEIKAALEKLKERRIKFEGLNSRVKEEGEISTADADARLMRCAGDTRLLSVCYNVQTAVDSKHNLVIDFELTNRANDYGNLHLMSEKAKEIMGVEKLTNLADKGYYYGKDITACENNGVTCLVSKPKSGGAKKTEGFRHEDFIYNREKDIYICPCKNTLYNKSHKKHKSGREYRVYANYSVCGKCQKKKECTTGAYREVERQKNQDTLDIVDERTRKNKTLYRRRQEIVEHPYGTIKAVWGFKQFLCRTKPKVTAETALTFLAYNMRRVFNISAGNQIKFATV